MSSIFSCCKRRVKKSIPNPNDIKLDLSKIKDKNKETSSLEVNQSQSLSMLSHNLNNSTKDNIFQRQNKFNIVNSLKENSLGIPNNHNHNERYNNVIYNIIKVDNINNINNNKNNIITKGLNTFDTKDKIVTIKEEKEEFSEREKKLFEAENKLSNKEKEINKILELIQKKKKMNMNIKKPLSKNSVINDVINFKKAVSNLEDNNKQNITSNVVKINNNENMENKVQSGIFLE